MPLGSLRFKITKPINFTSRWKISAPVFIEEYLFIRISNSDKFHSRTNCQCGLQN